MSKVKYPPPKTTPKDVHACNNKKRFENENGGRPSSSLPVPATVRARKWGLNILFRAPVSIHDTGSRQDEGGDREGVFNDGIGGEVIEEGWKTPCPFSTPR